MKVGDSIEAIYSGSGDYVGIYWRNDIQLFRTPSYQPSVTAAVYQCFKWEEEQEDME